MQPDDYKKIDQYLQNELPSAEQADFQERLQADESFAAELTMRQSMQQFLQAKNSRPALEEEMSTLSKEYFPREAKMRTLSGTRWMAGIAAAAVVGLLLWLWNPFSQTDLYEQYAQHQPLSLSEKSGAEPLAAEAEEAFNNGNYQQAFELLSGYLETKPDDNQARLAFGIAALELNNTTTAEAVFSALVSSESVFKSAGQWYLSLSYLKKGAKGAAISSLQKIAPNDPDYGSKAEELRQALE